MGVVLLHGEQMLLLLHLVLQKALDIAVTRTCYRTPEASDDGAVEAEGGGDEDGR